MKKSLLWLIITMMCIALIGTFTLAGCKTTAEETAEETTEEETEEATEETTEEEVEETTEEEAVSELTTDPVKLIHYHQNSDTGNEYIIQMSEEFMELYPNVELEVVFYNPEDLEAKVKTTIGAGTVQLDSFEMGNFSAAWFLENDVLAELTPESWGLSTTEEVVDLFVPGSFAATGCVYKGKYYGVPLLMNAWSAWLNKTHMVEAGLDPTNAPVTWDEFVEIAKALTVTEGEIITREGLGIINNAFWTLFVVNTMMQQKGLDWLSLEGMIAGCDDPGTVEVLTEFTDWVLVDKIWDPALTDDVHMGLANGQVSGTVSGGTWLWGVLSGAEANLDDYMPIPYPTFADGEKKLGLIYGMANHVTKISENPEWAYKWCEYMVADPEAWIGYGSQYIPKADLDASALADEIRDWSVFEETLNNGTPIISSTKFTEIQDAVYAATQRVIFEGMSNEDSVVKLKTDLEALQ